MLKYQVVISLLFFFAQFSFAQQQQPAGKSDIKSLVMNGNNITTIVYNTGSISRPGISANVLDFAWKGLGYAYETGLLVGSKVPRSGSTTDSLSIMSEGFYSSSDGEYGPDGTKWGWLPDSGFANPSSKEFAVNTNPATWPATWSAWPGTFGSGKSIADLESYYVINDFSKAEFPYYPFPADTLKRGLGIEVSVRHFQFDNPNLGDVFFSRYEMKNASPTSLAKVVAGLFIDPYIGGSNNYYDDAAMVLPAKQMGYFWDPDNVSDILTIKPGYFGIQFEETPVGSGLEELGLTSFAAPVFGGNNRPKNDALMWNLLNSSYTDTAIAALYYPTTGDNVGVFGTGQFALSPNATAVLATGSCLPTIWHRL